MPDPSTPHAGDNAGVPTLIQAATPAGTPADKAPDPTKGETPGRGRAAWICVAAVQAVAIGVGLFICTLYRQGQLARAEEQAEWLQQRLLSVGIGQAEMLRREGRREEARNALRPTGEPSATNGPGMGSWEGEGATRDRRRSAGMGIGRKETGGMAGVGELHCIAHPLTPPCNANPASESSAHFPPMWASDFLATEAAVECRTATNSSHLATCSLRHGPAGWRRATFHFPTTWNLSQSPQHYRN